MSIISDLWAKLGKHVTLVDDKDLSIVDGILYSDGRGKFFIQQNFGEHVVNRIVFSDEGVEHVGVEKIVLKIW